MAENIFNIFLTVWVLIGLGTFVYLFKTTAPFMGGMRLQAGEYKFLPELVG